MSESERYSKGAHLEQPSTMWSKDHYQRWQIANKCSNRRKVSPHRRFERRLDKLLSEKTRSRYIGDAYTLTSGSSSNLVDEDDDFSEELSRLGQIERNLSRELSQYQWFRAKSQSIKHYKCSDKPSAFECKDGMEKFDACHSSSDEMSSIVQELRDSLVRCRSPSAVTCSDLEPTEQSFDGVVRLIAKLKPYQYDIVSAIDHLIRKMPVESFTRGHGFFTKIGDLIFGRHEYEISVIYFDCQFGHDDFIRTREGAICIFISISTAIAYVFDETSTLHVLLRLFLPPSLTLFVLKIPFKDKETFIAVFILSIHTILSVQHQNLTQYKFSEHSDVVSAIGEDEMETVIEAHNLKTMMLCSFETVNKTFV